MRLSPTAFTRNRILTLPRMAALLMSGMRTSVQAELDGLFGALHGQAVRARAVSAQAFSKARRGLSAELFELARARLVELAQPYIDSMRWNGLRLLAADGSRLRVGTREGHDLRADHYAFALFLPGPELTLHAALHPADGSERQMLFEALDVLQPHTDLLLLDRGYLGNMMVAALAQREIPFCLRVDACAWTCVTAFARSGEAERIVTLAAPNEQDALDYELVRTPTTVRLIRDVTPGGRVRVLMTSLLDRQRYPAATFGALYHQRWRIGEAFKRLKHRLRLEAVTGLDYLALQQDFGAKTVADNLCTLLSDLDDAHHDDEPASRPDRVYALGALKPILGACLLRIEHCLNLLPKVMPAIHQARCRIQPARSYPRPPRKAKPHHHLAYKLA
ncbi:transposase [Paraburkholderia sp. D1E]|uniref:transposase n=1 Tax=Paraburkholderia sp. D1E TaxID=3461398 RepID=UPI0040467F3D